MAKSPMHSARGPKGMPKTSSSPAMGVPVSTSVSPGDGKDSGVERRPKRGIGVSEGEERRSARGVLDVMVIVWMVRGMDFVWGFIRSLVRMALGFC